ncbi:type II toxin-antitoxin system RelE/ParE family toxin [Cysteiniphilum halobium]|uniref:type II toxin-antitoxin system RelE/ParE family toxin n=1 Tax=Cysteiniphilum halobium TaxID=2219059 RepID=UPI003F843B3E
MNLIINQTNAFKKSVKKLSKQDKKTLDDEVRALCQNPLLGEQKKGDLIFLRVHKFKMNRQLMLLGYTYEEEKITLTLLKLGSHENFYRDIKRI